MKLPDKRGTINRMLALGLLASTAGCVGGGDAIAPGPRPLPSTAAVTAVSDGPVQIGAPYSIGGQRYTPVDQTDYDEVGYASWYGSELAGRPTANGEAFVAEGVSAAHRTLPLPSYVEVTRLDTGRTILVRINDRGPADSARLIDLSAGAAQQLGIAETGMVQVRVRRTNPVDTERLALRQARAVPARIDTPDSLLEILRERANRLPRPAAYRPAVAAPAPAAATPRAAPAPAPITPIAAAPAPTTGGFIVQVGAYSSRARATEVARRTGASVVQAGNIYRVRYTPFATQAEAQAAIARAAAAGQPGAVIVRQ